MIYLLRMVAFHSYLKLLEGTKFFLFVTVGTWVPSGFIGVEVADHSFKRNELTGGAPEWFQDDSSITSAALGSGSLQGFQRDLEITTTFWNCRLRKNAERWSATMQSYRGIGCRRIVTATYARSNTSFSKRVWTCMNTFLKNARKDRLRLYPDRTRLPWVPFKHLESTREIAPGGLLGWRWEGDWSSPEGVGQAILDTAAAEQPHARTAVQTKSGTGEMCHGQVYSQPVGDGNHPSISIGR